MAGESSAKRKVIRNMDRPTERQIAQWYPQLLRTAMRLTGRADDAADLVQEAVCRAWQRWGEFNGHCRPTTWLHRILVNCSLDWCRRQGRRPVGPLNAESSLVYDEPTAASGAEQAEQSDALRRAIAELPDSLRLPFVATVLDGRSYSDVADEMNLPIGTVGTRIHEARRRLASALQIAGLDPERR